MKSLLFIIIALIPLLDALAQDNALVGTWEAKDKNETVLLQLHANNTGVFDGTNLTYQTNGNELEVIYESGTIHYVYELKGTQLILKEGNLEHPYVFKKKPTKETENTQPVKNIDERLLGTWRKDNQSVQFLANGTMVKNGKEKWLYDTKDNKLRIVAGNTITESPYQVSDSLLHLVIDGQMLQLKK